MRLCAGPTRLLVRLLLPAVAAGLLVGCTGGGEPSIPSPLSPGATLASPTEPVLPATPPPRVGDSSDTCTGGWRTPPTDSATWNFPLGIIRQTTGEQGSLAVVDMRLFVGSESPPSDKNYLKDIKRWYVKLYAKDDLSFQGRFLVEKRRFGSGLVAVAPYDTGGFSSPDWVGFQWTSSDATRRVYPGLPGQWRGTAYDFVSGGAGLDLPGLPSTLVGCLDGT